MSARRGAQVHSRAFGQCIALLRRGIVSGGDIDDLVEVYRRATGAIGLSIGIGFGFSPDNRVVDISPEWTATHRRMMGHDPSPAVLDARGPYGVYGVRRDTVDRRDPLFRELERHGYVDAAVTRPRGGEDPVYMAAYRPRSTRAFDDEDLARMTALLPWFSLAFAPKTATEALAAQPREREDNALRRLGAYAVLGPTTGTAQFSPKAEKLLTACFGSFGPRGRRRVEEAIRRAHARVLEGVGSRTFWLRGDLLVDLALLPRAGADAALLARFIHRAESLAARLPKDLPHERLLSPRQQIVARFVAAGESLPSVARALGIRADVVKAHLREAYDRLGVRTRAELVALYVPVR